MRIRSVLLSAVALLGLGSCLKVIKPSKDFGQYSTPAAPNYAQPESWAALPTRRDSADAVPRNTNFQDQQATAAADVFFVHPTTYYWRKQWNASLSNDRVNQFTDDDVIRGQASAFNAAARVYAPRYRQATLYAFFVDSTKTENGQKALDLAYSDVKSAFQYYLAHYNQGRPIIIAGHSQGTVHATRLLREFFDTDPQLRQRLVAAYLIGFKVNPDQYQTLRPCADSTQTGCYVAWNTVAWGNAYPPFENGVAVNPLTWTLDTLAAPASLNRGGVGQDFNRLDVGVVDAKVHRGLLWVHPPKPSGYPRFLLPGQPQLWHSFHIADYGLFYANIRQNAVTRVRAWQARGK